MYREFSDSDEHSSSDSIFPGVDATITNWLFTYNLCESSICLFIRCRLCSFVVHSMSCLFPQCGVQPDQSNGRLYSVDWTRDCTVGLDSQKVVFVISESQNSGNC